MPSAQPIAIHGAPLDPALGEPFGSGARVGAEVTVVGDDAHPAIAPGVVGIQLQAEQLAAGFDHVPAVHDRQVIGVMEVVVYRLLLRPDLRAADSATPR